MPKVSEEYIENKKKYIVDCTYKVCLRKPVEMVTMTDLIEETGLWVSLIKPVLIHPKS